MLLSSAVAALGAKYLHVLKIVGHIAKLAAHSSKQLDPVENLVRIRICSRLPPWNLILIEYYSTVVKFRALEVSQEQTLRTATPVKSKSPARSGNVEGTTSAHSLSKK